MPADPQTFAARIDAATDTEGRLPVPDMSMADWDIFPFEHDGLRVRPVLPATIPEPPRLGETGGPCRACDEPDSSAVWVDDRWRLRTFSSSGVPLILVLQPRAHVDLADLDDTTAAELGVLSVHIARHVEALPHVARCHVYRIGDGSSHLHPFFFARPEGFLQLRGSCLVLWDDLLPRVPADEVDADARTVAAALVTSYGGRLVEPA